MNGEIDFFNPGVSGLKISNPEEPRRFRGQMFSIKRGVKWLNIYSRIEWKLSLIVPKQSFNKKIIYSICNQFFEQIDKSVNSIFFSCNSTSFLSMFERTDIYSDQNPSKMKSKYVHNHSFVACLSVWWGRQCTS